MKYAQAGMGAHCDRFDAAKQNEQTLLQSLLLL